MVRAITASTAPTATTTSCSLTTTRPLPRRVEDCSPVSVVSSLVVITGSRSTVILSRPIHMPDPKGVSERGTRPLRAEEAFMPSPSVVRSVGVTRCCGSRVRSLGLGQAVPSRTRPDFRPLAVVASSKGAPPSRAPRSQQGAALAPLSEGAGCSEWSDNDVTPEVKEQIDEVAVRLPGIVRPGAGRSSACR